VGWATSSAPHSAQKACDEDRGSYGVEMRPCRMAQTILSLRSVGKPRARKARRSWNSGNRVASLTRSPPTVSGDGPAKAAKSVRETVVGDDPWPRKLVHVDDHWCLAPVFDTSLPWLGSSL
jgi:hypothetical protein